MPTRSLRQRGLKEQDTNSPNIINNITLRSKSLRSTKNLDDRNENVKKNIGPTMAKSVIAIYQDENSNSSHEANEYFKQRPLPKSPAARGRPRTPNSITPTHAKPKTIPEKSLQRNQKPNIPISTNDQSIQVDTNDIDQESLENILLKETPQDFKFWKNKAEKYEEELDKLNKSFEILELKYNREMDVASKRDEAIESLQVQNENLIKQCDEKDEQILELVEMLEKGEQVDGEDVDTEQVASLDLTVVEQEEQDLE